MPDYPPLQFAGFDAPHYTQTPDVLFDELLPYLSEAELKVLLYIVRRTFGFKKEADTISVGQMVEGIVTRDGRRLDWGAGCSESSVKRGIRGLLAKGLILREPRRSPERGDEAPIYRLRMRGDRGPESTPGEGQTDPRGDVKLTPPPGPESTPQETGQETAGQEYPAPVVQEPTATIRLPALPAPPNEHQVAARLAQVQRLNKTRWRWPADPAVEHAIARQWAAEGADWPAFGARVELLARSAHSLADLAALLGAA